MKKSLSLFIIAGLAAFLFSCDKMDQPHIKVQYVDCPVPEFPVLTTHLKRVLLEDYTGHLCPNCPAAGKTARDLVEQNEGKVVLMAVHAGYFASVPPAAGVPASYAYDFRSVAGTDWDAFFGNGSAGNPNGLVNRMKVSGKYVVQPAQWSGVISTALAEDPKMDLQLIVNYDQDTRKICVHTKSYFLTPLDQNLNILACITEDSIIAPQKNSNASIGATPEITDFVHMHVMRGAINYTWGSPLVVKGTTLPATMIKSLQGELPSICVPKNCRIIAFVFDAETKEVLQAAETKLVE